MLSSVTPAARVAYAKFKISKIKQEFAEKEDRTARGLKDSLTDEEGLKIVVIEGEDEVFEQKKSSPNAVSFNENPTR